jgi:hypothetical protein
VAGDPLTQQAYLIAAQYDKLQGQPRHLQDVARQPTAGDTDLCVLQEVSASGNPRHPDAVPCIGTGGARSLRSRTQLIPNAVD